MGKFQRNYEDVERREASEGYTGDVPKPGIYEAVLFKCQDHEGPSGDGTEWQFDITEEPYVGWRGYTYTNDAGAAWKELQILEALGIIEEGQDTVNTTHEKIMKNARPVRIKVKNETYEGEKKGKITTVLPPLDGAKKKGSSSKKGKKAKDDETPF